MTSTEIAKLRKAEIEAARKIHNDAESANRELTEEETARFNEHMANVEKFDAKSSRSSKLEILESSLKESAGRISQPEPVHNEIERYSIVRAIRCVAERRPLDGIEGEVNAELIKKMGKSPQGFYMPHRFSNKIVRYDNDNLDTDSGEGGLNSTTMYENFIELLRNKMLMTTLGAQVINDLSGTVQIPKQTGGATAYWINADGSSTITKSYQSIGQVPLAPNTCGALTEYTRAFVSQTSMDVENFVRNDLATVVAIELDRVGFNGSGSGAEPEGVLSADNIGDVALGAQGDYATFADIVELETKVAIANADVGKLAYVTTPAGRGILKSTQVAENAPRMIWENNQVNGYNAYATNQLPSNLTKGSSGVGLSACVFGNFLDCLYGFWGGLDVLVNPYTNDDAGSIRVRVLQDVDFAIRHPESFAAILDMKTA